MKRILLFLFLVMSTHLVYTQGVAINTDNSTPDGSAMLDVKSTNKGILIPRMTTAQRVAITGTATALLVYDSSTSSFWYYNGTTWVEIAGGGIVGLVDADGDTQVQVEESADEDVIRFDMAGTEYFVMTNGRLQTANNGRSVFIGENAGLVDNHSNNYNVAIGYNAYDAAVNGVYNIAIGANSQGAATSGTGNSSVGYNSMLDRVSASYNSAFGIDAMHELTTGGYNIGMGSAALYDLNTGANNVGIGTAAGGDITSGGNNVAIGFHALRENTTASNNVGIGYRAGYNNITGRQPDCNRS